MKALVKVGGTLLESPESRAPLAAELAALAREHSLTIVHGGGKQMTAFLAERGVESRFVDGLRVTTPEITDALLKIFAGSVNHQLVGALTAAGARAVGLSGIDAGLAIAEQMNPRWGAAGRIVRADAAILDHLVAGGFLPVVACVAGGVDGSVYNVNADQMAVACAAAFRAEALIFLTDVAGVRGAEGETIAALTPSDCAALICAGVATGGMQAKLESASAAVAAGVGQVVITLGSRAGALRAAIEGKAFGTRIHA
jgi:acetylglutamate kinase